MFFKIRGFTWRIEQRKIREVYGLYSSVKEVPGVVHFDDFAAAVRSFSLFCSFFINLEETLGFRSYDFIHRNVTHTLKIKHSPKRSTLAYPWEIMPQEMLAFRRQRGGPGLWDPFLKRSRLLKWNSNKKKSRFALRERHFQ